MKVKIALIAAILALAVGFVYFDVGHYLTLEYIKSQQVQLAQLVAESPVRAGLFYFLIYVSIAALSLPGAAILTLLGGAIFGLWQGVVIVSFASTLGATLAMLASRFILRQQVVKRFGSQLKKIDTGIEKEGAFYLFSLRLVPAFPFFAINLLMGLTKISVPKFFIVSQVGMLAGTVVFVNAGTQLAQIETISDILSPTLIASFMLLGIFPLVAKRMIDFIAATKMLRNYSKPKSFDRDVIVIGAGSGGLVAALIAATVKAKVTLVEKHKMGGDCLNTGCVPSKSLLRSAKFAFDLRRGDQLGFAATEPDFDFKDVMARVQRIISSIEPHDSVERFESLGVDCAMAEARILSPYLVEVGGKVLSTRNIIVATGAAPFVPDIAGIEKVKVLTSDNLWALQNLPRRLIVLGGGPIGTELTQAFSRLGSHVTQVEALPNILNREDPEISAMMAEQLRSEGVAVLVNSTAIAIELEQQDKYLVVDSDGSQQRIEFDEILVAVGRKANVKGFGLEELGVEIAPQGTIVVDEYLRTNYPNIYAIGDVAGPYQFTHTASHMSWYATVNALFGSFKKFKVDYSVVPWATFCSPEVARVGLNETEATQQGLDFEVTKFDVAELDRALADEEAMGVVKVITQSGSDKILGVTIVADHAGDLISEYVLAMKHGLGLGKIMATIHIYPTMAEMNKFAAGEWRKAHKPDWALGLAGKYHAWRRN
ncbi:MAG: dihydrolipoyl dehydrogenase [Pseudomonadales bacterium]|nr:dihydrolipoyl dehydrogenase [Pseudomonadales bacterium]